MTDKSVQRAFRGPLLVEKSLKHMVVSGMTDGTPNVAAMVEESERYVYCDNDYFDEVKRGWHWLMHTYNYLPLRLALKLLEVIIFLCPIDESTSHQHPGVFR